MVGKPLQGGCGEGTNFIKDQAVSAGRPAADENGGFGRQQLTQRAEFITDQGVIFRVDEAECDDAGVVLGGGSGDFGSRQIGAEVGDPPTEGGGCGADDEGAHFVDLTGRGGDDQDGGV